jgi:uncharacterized protein (TIGR03067 family)
LLARRLASRGVTLSAGALAAALAGGSASASVGTGLVVSTGKAATRFASGEVAAIPTKVALLTEGVLKTMLLSKLKAATAVLLVIVLGVLGVATLPIRDTQAAAQTATPKDAKPGAPVHAGKSVSDTKKLQGVWTVTEQRLNGETYLPVAGLRHELVIEGDEFRLWSGGNGGFSGYNATFKLNSRKSPRHINLISCNDAEKQELILGIYELDGDNLRLCFPYEEPWDSPRPTEFKAGKGLNFEVYELKRKEAATKR